MLNDERDQYGHDKHANNRVVQSGALDAIEYLATFSQEPLEAASSDGYNRIITQADLSKKKYQDPYWLVVGFICHDFAK